VSYLDILGRRIRVNTIHGPVEVSLPPGTQPGTVLRIADKGVPKLGSPTRRGRARRSGPEPGEDLRLDLEIDFEKAIFGGEEKIRISHLETCETCSGSGMRPGSSPRMCTMCGGAGVVTQVARTPLGAFQSTQTCPNCRGAGEVVDEYCGTCGGRGRVQTQKQLMLTIPAGVDDGSRLRVRSEGDAGTRGGPPGDLYVYIKVRPHPEFRREDLDIYSECTVSYLDAILGRRIRVNTIHGPVEVSLPPVRSLALYCELPIRVYRNWDRQHAVDTTT
jgi:molecular chaperone DnaJ